MPILLKEMTLLSKKEDDMKVEGVRLMKESDKLERKEDNFRA